MARAIKHKDRRAVLLSRIPEGTKRVQVKTDTGKICFKALDDLAKTDEIQTKKDGTPIVMKKEPGRNRDVVLTPTTPKTLSHNAGNTSQRNHLRNTPNNYCSTSPTERTRG